VLPILHLNGSRSPIHVLARIGRQELTELLRGYGYEPISSRRRPDLVHQALAGTLDLILARIRQIQPNPVWRSEQADQAAALADDRLPDPKGWTAEIRRRPAGRGTWRAHQVPLDDLANPEHLKQLEEWMLSYRPRSCSTTRQVPPGLCVAGANRP